jgi:hypothetical protein
MANNWDDCQTQLISRQSAVFHRRGMPSALGATPSLTLLAVRRADIESFAREPGPPSTNAALRARYRRPLTAPESLPRREPVAAAPCMTSYSTEPDLPETLIWF